MKVLFWMSGSFDRRTPSEHLLTAIIEALYQKGHTVHVIQKDTGGTLPKLPAGLEELGVTTQCIPFVPAQKSNFIVRYLADVKYVFACKKHISKNDGYGAVFMQSTNVAGFALHILKRKIPEAPVTYNVQDIFPYNAVFSGNMGRNSLPFKVLAAIQRYAYKRADHLITISEDMRNLLVSDGVPADKIEHIYNWSYRDEPYKAEELDCTVARQMFPREYINVVYAGNIGVMQNVDVIIRAAALMNNEKKVWFHIIGDGAYKEKLQMQAKAAEITNLTFHPMQSSELAPSIYVTADINVIPLVKDIYKTALPSKTATCLACGKPIIFCIGKASKFAQMVNAKTGCPIVDSDDAEGVKQAILEEYHDYCANGLNDLFALHFRKTTNSMRYADIITGE